MGDEWEFVLALPNLEMSPNKPCGPFRNGDRLDLDSGTIALISGSHEIVRNIMRANTVVECILGSFRDAAARPYTPAVIVARTSSPAALRNSARAFNDFRNAIAVCAVLPARARLASGGGSGWDSSPNRDVSSGC